MRLKRLEMLGFKSFATRTVLVFDEGITAIVGPNGSGKSNIADAVRWVMGEQSYSSMRAKTTEDMIFAGSRNRSRLGMAEVLLVFDNTSGWLPLDFAEVSVGRRAFRSGENEYLLNGNKVRYRDILELLSGAGLARSNYTVIGQGMVDAALALRPEARRALFEEAAGITPQLRKRDEALQRIAETERNLERVHDIANELEPRVHTLQRQAERAKDHAILQQDLRELQRIWYGYQWQRLSTQLIRAEEILKDRQAQLEDRRIALRHLDERQEQSALEYAQLRQTVEELVTQQSTLHDQSESLRREVAVAAERLRLYTSQRQALAKEVTTLQTRQQVVRGEVELSSLELAHQEAELAASQSDLATARQEQAQSEVTRREIGKLVAREQSSANKILVVLSDLQSRSEQAAERRVELANDCHEGEARLTVIVGKVEALRERLNGLIVQEQALAEQLVARQTERQTAEEEARRAQGMVRAFEQERNQAQTRLDGLASRRDSLARLRQEMPGYHPSVREVLAPESGLPGLLGTVANLMRVPLQLEEAIESALGPRLQNVITERWEDAEGAIAHLKQSGTGWATFLPLDTIRSRPPTRFSAESGVVGVACTLVQFDDRLRPVYELLLGTVLIVQDLPTARRLLNASHGISLFVTLGGETVQPSGALSGGARRNSGNLLAQEREWRELPEKISEAGKNQASVVERLEAARLQVRNAQTRQSEADLNLARHRTAVETLRNNLAAQQRELAAAEADQVWQRTRMGQSQKELAALQSREQDLNVRLVAAQLEQTQILERLRSATERLAALDDSPRQRLAALETRVAVVQRTVHSQRVLLDSHKANLEQINAQTNDKQTQDAALLHSLDDQSAGHAVNSGRLLELDQKIEALKVQLAPQRTSLKEFDHIRQAMERERSSTRERLSDVTLECDRASRECDRLLSDREALARDLEGDLGPIMTRSADALQLRLNLGGEVVLLPVVPVMPEGLEERIRSLRNSLRRMGEVNPAAPEEYAQTSERLRFLQAQEVDLRTAIVSLQQLIHELENLIEHDLHRTFKLVQRSFGDYFTSLFNGGSAELQLTEPEKISETGVDIVARLPGKRSQNLALLSGGERALTAVALLFALLQANPVPFCILDEVDAALDEANIQRFRELLQRQAVGTQFVVITHNRRTIEAASAIYGVAMGEQGVSQMISLKVQDPLPNASQVGAE
ncbi:MAG: chromosome segregation protein SMC [Anaerolineae bacterium]